MSEHAEYGSTQCLCCEEEPGTIVDPHLGPVCSGCYLCLIQARGALEEFGPFVGIAGCQEKNTR